MKTIPELLQKLITSFEEIQNTIQSISSSKNKILDGYTSQGFTQEEALKEFNATISRLQTTADDTSKEIRKLLN